MPESLYITRAEFNQLRKEISYLAEYVRNSLKVAGKSKWVKPAEAMELIGCKKTRLSELRNEGKLKWRFFGKGRGVMVLRSSIEQYNNTHSTMIKPE